MDSLELKIGEALDQVQRLMIANPSEELMVVLMGLHDALLRVKQLNGKVVA